MKYNSSCYSNLFQSDGNQTSTAANIPGLTCPTLYLQRPSNQSDLTTAYFYNYVAADPQLYSYQGCTCTQPLVAYYYDNATSGLVQPSRLCFALSPCLLAVGSCLVYKCLS